MTKNKYAKLFNETELMLVIDTREPDNMIKNFLAIIDPEKIDIKQLQTSDYMIGQVGFERKKDDIVNMKDVIAKCSELKSQFPYAILMVQHTFDECVSLCIARGMSRNHFVGMVSSLVARGVVPIFAGKRQNMIELMLAIGVKCNDGKDRTYIEPLRPQASADDYQLRVLKDLGLGEDGSKRLLSYYGTARKVIDSLIVLPHLDKNTKYVMGLSGLDAKIDKAIMILESKSEVVI